MIADALHPVSAEPSIDHYHMMYQQYYATPSGFDDLVIHGDDV